MKIEKITFFILAAGTSLLTFCIDKDVTLLLYMLVVGIIYYGYKALIIISAICADIKAKKKRGIKNV